MELIKLRTKEEVQSVDTSNYLKQKFIESCINLDTSIFEPLINEDTYFQDKDKYRFLQSLKDVFDKVKAKQTELKYGKCGFCNNGCITHEFYSYQKHSNYTVERIEFAYMIEEKDNRVVDIYKCNQSSGSDFKLNLDPHITFNNLF